ncbi:hypothetical protein CPC08DRAFT_704565 [Agrocybe pediades]|nr:hypothetical protein CPC08DRAFT_704565 [Agrocybe pediades]
MSDMVRAEITKQVKEQVDEQIVEHLPQSLQEQAEESKKQVEDVKISLANSEARLQNSFVQTDYVYDRLAPILSAKGEMSPYYPVNVKSLFTYDLESAKELNRHYELTDSDNLQMNFKQFLKHIGTNVEVPVPEEGD